MLELIQSRGQGHTLLLLTGVGFGMWEVWLMRDFTSEQIVSMGTWVSAA